MFHCGMDEGSILTLFSLRSDYVIIWWKKIIWNIYTLDEAYELVIGIDNFNIPFFPHTSTQPPSAQSLVHTIKEHQLNHKGVQASTINRIIYVLLTHKPLIKVNIWWIGHEVMTLKWVATNIMDIWSHDLSMSYL